LWLERRWAPALWHTAAYLLIGLFWASYWRLAMPTPLADAGSSAAGLLERGLGFLATFDVSDPYLMALNLLRFATWQNPLLVPLLLLGAWAAGRRDPAALTLWGALLGTLGAMALLLPYQGHGWGYRYLHGLLGVAALLAAGGWLRLVDRLEPPGRDLAWRSFAVLTAATALVLLPLRAWQTHDYVKGPAAASRLIAAADADVVLVDSTRVPFGWDLVRNDPWLRERPKVLLLDSLGAAETTALCRSGSVAVFDQASARSLGMRTPEATPPANAAKLRALMRELGCGRPLLAR
jgi:hypothetical protein